MAEQADPRTDRVAAGREVEPEDRPVAAFDRQQSGAQAQQARLAGAIGAAEQHDFATVDAKRGACEHREAAEHGDDLVERDGWLVGSSLVVGSRHRPAATLLP